MATRYFAYRRREELPGWRSPSDSRSPGLSLSVRRPYYVTDRGLYNSQPRYPRSRGLRVSMPVLPQVRARPGALLRVQLRNRRLDLDVEGDDTDRGWEAHSRRSVDNSQSHHRHPSGQLDLMVGNGNRVNLGPLWASSTLQRITRSRSTEEIESVRCQFPRPQAARSQSDWEPEALQERTLLRRLRPRRFAPEILFQAPPPRVRRKRPAASSLSTALGEAQRKELGSQVSGEEADSGEYESSEEYEESSGEEREKEYEDASQNCSSPFSSTSGEAPAKVEFKRVASRREEKRPVSEVEARRAASEKVAARWPAGLLEPAKPKRPKKAADPVSESAPAAEKKPKNRKQKHSVVTVLQQGEVIDLPQDACADTSMPSATEKLLNASQSEINASRPPEVDETMMTLGIGGDKQTTFDSAPQTAREVETRVPSAQGATRASEEPSNADMRKPRPKKQVDLGYPTPFSDVELSSESSDDPRPPEAHVQVLDLSDPPKRRRKRSFTSVEARLKATDIQNLSFHSSSAIEERPDTEELSEFSRPSEAPARVSRQGARTFTRRPNRTMSTGKESVASRAFTPAVERPGSHQSPGLSRSRDQWMSADDWTLASTLRMPAARAEVSGKGADTDRSSKSVKKAGPPRPATSQKVTKPRPSLHPMAQTVDSEAKGVTMSERRLQRRQDSKEPSRDTPALTDQQSSERLRLADTPQSAEKLPLSEKSQSAEKLPPSEKSQSADQLQLSEKPRSSEKLDLNEKSLPPKSPSPEKAEAPGQSGARKSEDEGKLSPLEDSKLTPLDELVLNISASVLSIINQLLLSDPERLRAKLLPVLESITIKPSARKEKEEEPVEALGPLPQYDPQPVRSYTIPKAIAPTADSIPKSQSLTKVETIKRKLAETKATAQPKKQAKKPLSLTTRVAMITAKDAVKKISPKPKARKQKPREQSSSSSSPASSVEDTVEEVLPKLQSQFRMAEYEKRQMSFIQKLAEDLLKGSDEADPAEPEKPEFPDSDDEEFMASIHNKGFDVHRRMQSMFELMRYPVQNAFTAEIDKELKPRPPPSRETVLPQEIIVDRKNREDARLVQKFKLRLDSLASHDSLAQQQEGTLFQTDHRRLDPREVREYYVRMGRLKRHDAAARRGVKLNAQPEYTFSHLEVRYYLNEFAKLHPRKRDVLPPIRSRLEDLYEERIYGRLKNDPDGKLFPSHSRWRLDSLEASLEELEHVSQHNSTHRSSL